MYPIINNDKMQQRMNEYSLDKKYPECALNARIFYGEPFGPPEVFPAGTFEKMEEVIILFRIICPTPPEITSRILDTTGFCSNVTKMVLMYLPEHEISRRSPTLLEIRLGGIFPFPETLDIIVSGQETKAPLIFRDDEMIFTGWKLLITDGTFDKYDNNGGFVKNARTIIQLKETLYHYMEHHGPKDAPTIRHLKVNLYHYIEHHEHEDPSCNVCTNVPSGARNMMCNICCEYYNNTEIFGSMARESMFGFRQYLDEYCCDNCIQSDPVVKVDLVVTTGCWSMISMITMMFTSIIVQKYLLQ